MMAFRIKHFIELVARWIVGAVFVFSGFVKAVDPWGSAYKFSDYFTALNLQFLDSFALFFGIVLAAIEFAIGLNLLFRNHNGLNLKLLAIFMAFFTGLTLWIAIANPVSDCGCFGDAIVMSNWQTFFKNLILSAFTLILFRWNENRNKSAVSRERLKTIFFVSFSVGISLYGLLNLPILDFRPYKVGVNIPDEMKVPEGAPVDEYKSVFYYSKDGETREFDETNYPWQDTTWTFVEMKSELIAKGYTPPIHDLSIVSNIEGDITQQILRDKGYTFLLIAPQIKLNKLKKVKAEIIQVQQFCLENEIPLYMVSSTSDEKVIAAMHAEFDLPLNVANADEITLKTIVRSNPGLLILKEGYVIAKFAGNRIPETALLKDPLKLTIGKGRRFNNQINLLTLGLVFGGLVWLLSKTKKKDNN